MKHVGIIILTFFFVIGIYISGIFTGLHITQTTEQTTEQSTEQEDTTAQTFLPQKDKTQKIVKAKTPVHVQETDPLIQFFPEKELKIIRKEAIENYCTGDLLYVLLAIRRAEAGRSGLEFGVMHPKAKNTNLETQAGWAAATVAKNYQRWKQADTPDSFIVFLGNRYCPIGADNDPQGLNQHWVKNVTFWYKKLKKCKRNKI